MHDVFERDHTCNSSRAYEVGVATRRSFFHKNNEDAYRIRPMGGDRLCLALVDGVGGTGRESVGWYSEVLANKAIEDMCVFDSPRRAMESLESYAILSEPSAERNHAAVLLAMVTDNKVSIAWKGDVTAWKRGKSPNDCTPLTTPHRDAGGALRYCVGDGKIYRISSLRSVLHHGEILILATDGARIDHNVADRASCNSDTMQELATTLVGTSPDGDDVTVITVRGQ